MRPASKISFSLSWVIIFFLNFLQHFCSWSKRVVEYIFNIIDLGHLGRQA